MEDEKKTYADKYLEDFEKRNKKGATTPEEIALKKAKRINFLMGLQIGTLIGAFLIILMIWLALHGGWK